MNRKIIWIICIIIVIIISIIMLKKFTNMNNSKNVNAKLASNEVVKLRVNKTDEGNEELYVGFNNTSIASMTLEIFFDTKNLEYENNMENSNYSDGRLLYTWVSETGKNESINEIGPFKFKKMTDTNSKVVVTGEFYNEKGERINIDSQSINIISSTQKIDTDDEEKVENKNSNNANISKDNTNLSVLRLNHEGISPNFAKDIKEYYIVVDETLDKFDITTIAENPNSTINITGNNNLKTGLNTININVKSEDKTKETNYKIYVTKTSNIEKANANLENLAVENGTLNPEFDANITNYKVEVSSDTDTVNVLAVPERINAKVNINKENKLEVGDNTIEITVNAEDNITKKKYVVIVHRRNNEEENQLKEEKKQQAEKLSAILQKNNNINNNMEQEVVKEENVEVTSELGEKNNQTFNNIYVYSTAGIAIILIIICVIYNKRKKSKEQYKN